MPGDRPVDIASGPTVADATTCADALAIIRRHGIEPPAPVREVLESGRGESVKPGDARLERADVRIIATPQMALEAAARVAQAAGDNASHRRRRHRRRGAGRGARVFAGMALQVAGRNQPFAAPCVLLSGGETTVTVRGGGRGGRNVEFLLSLAIGLEGHAGVYALAGDTDGVDGQEEIAGGCIAPDSLARAVSLGASHPRTCSTTMTARLFFGAGGFGGHRSHPYQCERFSRHFGRVTRSLPEMSSIGERPCDPPGEQASSQWQSKIRCMAFTLAT